MRIDVELSKIENTKIAREDFKFLKFEKNRCQEEVKGGTTRRDVL